MEKVNEESFLASYKAYTDELYRYCYFKLLNKEEATDALAETFMKTWDYVRNGGTVGNMRAFLYRTAHNIIVDGFRKKKSLSLDKLFEDGFDTANDVNEAQVTIDKIDGAQAMKLLSKIPPQYAEVIMMQYVDELSVTEISEILGESPGNISIRIHRGLEKLKKMVRDNG